MSQGHEACLEGNRNIRISRERIKKTKSNEGISWFINKDTESDDMYDNCLSLGVKHSKIFKVLVDCGKVKSYVGEPVKGSKYQEQEEV